MTWLNIFHSGGLQYIPIGLFICALVSFYRYYQQNKSGYVRQETDKTSPNWGKDVPAERPSPFRVGSFVFGCIFLASAIASFIAIAISYKGV